MEDRPKRRIRIKKKAEGGDEGADEKEMKQGRDWTTRRKSEKKKRRAVKRLRKTYKTIKRSNKVQKIERISRMMRIIKPPKSSTTPRPNLPSLNDP